MSPSPERTGAVRAVARWALAGLLAVAGVSHLTWGRRGYRIVVPDWATRLTTLDKDAIVVASGAVELMLGGALVALPKEKKSIGWLVAAFFVAVLPGKRPPVADRSLRADAAHRPGAVRPAPPAAAAGRMGTVEHT